MKIVLDTHVLIHAAFTKLSDTRSALLEEGSNRLFFSQISAWEIMKLVQYNKITFEDGLESFLERLFSHPRYTVIGLEPKILSRVLEIADTMHKDPADQIIVATAMVLDASLMTNDGDIRAMQRINCV